MHYEFFLLLGAVSNVQGHLFCLSVLSDVHFNLQHKAK